MKNKVARFYGRRCVSYYVVSYRVSNSVVYFADGVTYIATFYGDSWIRLPLNDSVTRLRLHLDFLTGRPGPLFYAVGSVDFLYVEVTSSGRVHVGVELGAGRATLSSPPGVSSVADLRWHSVSVVLDRSGVRLTLDDVFESRAALPGDFTELNIDVGLRLGDARIVEEFPLMTRQPSATSFRGCLRSVVFNGVDVLAISRRTSRDSASRPTAVLWNRSEPIIGLRDLG